MCFSSSFSSLSPPTRLVVTSVNDPLRNQLPGKEKCTHASLNFFAAYVHCPFFFISNYFSVLFLSLAPSFCVCLSHVRVVCVLSSRFWNFFDFLARLIIHTSSLCDISLSCFSMAFIILTHFAYFSPSLPPRKKNKTEIVLYTNAIATDGRCEKTPKDNNKTK